MLETPADGYHSEVPRWQVALLTGWSACWLAVVIPDFDLNHSDFHSFYESGAAWLAGRNPYIPTIDVWPNMNTPWSLPIFALFATMPLPLAFALWTVVGACVLALTCRDILRVTKHGSYLPVVLIALLPTWYVWHKGQITWLLTACVTQAWMRRAQWNHAGAWLIPAIVIKPPLAIMAALLPWPTAAVALTGSVLTTLWGIVGFGPELWLEWFDAGLRAHWVGLAANASVWGVASRLTTWTPFGGSMRDISAVGVLAVFITGVLAIWRTTRQTDSKRWALAAIASVLVSPLGWIYYLPLALGPVFALWPTSRWWIVAIAIWCIPRSVFVQASAGPPWLVVTFGSLTCLSAVAMFIAVDRGQHVSGTPK